MSVVVCRVCTSPVCVREARDPRLSRRDKIGRVRVSLGVVCPKWLVPFPSSLSSRDICIVVRVGALSPPPYSHSLQLAANACPRHPASHFTSRARSNRSDNRKSLTRPRCPRTRRLTKRPFARSFRLRPRRKCQDQR